MTDQELKELGIDRSMRGFENFDPNSAEGRAYIQAKKRLIQQDPSIVEKPYHERLGDIFKNAPKSKASMQGITPMRDVIPKINHEDVMGENAKRAYSEYTKRVHQADRERKKKPTVQDFRTEVYNRLGASFQSTKENEAAIEKIVRYYAQGYRESAKGIWLFGGIGTGKTTIAKAVSGALLAINHPFAPVFVDSKTIEREQREDDTDVVFKYKQQHWMFDDVGFENEVKSYGNNVDPMLEILFAIYQIRTYKRPFVTSNLSPEADDQRSIFARYGDRVYSRCCEMFNFIYLGGPDYRKI